MTILDEILDRKRLEVADAKKQPDAGAVAQRAKECPRPTLGFRSAICNKEGVSVIAEIKRQSPSKGLIREDFDAVKIARAYVEAEAACISVLTDEHFFGGSLDDLVRVRAVVDIPLIRKDFVVDSFQIDEARLAGADAVLLIVSALETDELAHLDDHAKSLSLDVLVEVNSEDQLDQALAIGAKLIGVNNRDLRTFFTDLATTERLAARLSDTDITLIAESGIATVQDVARLEKAGATGFLVGESLMRQPDPGEALRELRRRL